MLDKIKEDLESRGVFTTPIPNFFIALANTIPNYKVPEKMKLAIAVSEFILFMGQFRRNIKIWNNSLIPINAISFIISGSGSGKDSSVNTMRKNFTDGYQLIEQERKEKAKSKAIERAKNDNLAKPSDPESYMKYYRTPTPLFVAPSTPEGFIQHLNELDEEKIGSTLVYSGEIGGELENSSVIAGMLQLLSELYDEGKKEVKMLKDREKQTREIRNLPVNGLFVGTKDQIIYDESVKKKFKIEFNSKLARRSFFCYNQKEVEDIQYNTTKDLLDDQRAREKQANELCQTINDQMRLVAEVQNTYLGTPIELSDEAWEIYNLYKSYNEYIAKEIDGHLSTSKLCRMHLQWKALKLSGAISIFKGENIISKQSFKEAIAYVEYLADDMEEFEKELNKEPYEIFASLAKDKVNEDGTFFFSLHYLKKLGYISGTNIDKKVEELVKMATSYDSESVYIAEEKGIKYIRPVSNGKFGVSYLACSGTKEERKAKCANGFEYKEVKFKHLAELLTKDYVYCPFKFKDGKRSKDNIESGTNWIVFDVDKSLFTDKQCHYILSNFNHHIARTSDPDNDKKFRVLLELDSTLDVDDKVYKHFMRKVSEELALDVDILPKSQIYFSYANREVLSVTDKEPYPIRDNLIKSRDETTPIKSYKEEIEGYSKGHIKSLIDDPYGTFIYAFNASYGSGSRNLIRAAKHAKDLGMDKEKIFALMRQINNYWEDPMEETRFQNTILNQIEGWF